MNMYNSIKKYFDKGYYTTEQMKVFVQAKWITEEDYKTITGVDYIAPA